MTSFNLRQVKLHPGEALRYELEVELAPLRYGGQLYVPVPDTVPASFEVARANTGTAFSLSFSTRLHGPCYRCLGDAVLDLAISAREYQATTPDDEQLATPYLDGMNLELSDWARDAVALALPEKILCTADCAGLCPVCGQKLDDGPHTHEEAVVDLRWAPLEQLREP